MNLGIVRREIGTDLLFYLENLEEGLVNLRILLENDVENSLMNLGIVRREIGTDLLFYLENLEEGIWNLLLELENDVENSLMNLGIVRREIGTDLLFYLENVEEAANHNYSTILFQQRTQNEASTGITQRRKWWQSMAFSCAVDKVWSIAWSRKMANYGTALRRHVACPTNKACGHQNDRVFSEKLGLAIRRLLGREDVARRSEATAGWDRGVLELHSPCAILTAGILILMVTFVDLGGRWQELCLGSTGPWAVQDGRWFRGRMAVFAVVARIASDCSAYHDTFSPDGVKKRGRRGPRAGPRKSDGRRCFCPPPPHLRPAVSPRLNESIRRFTCFHRGELHFRRLSSSRAPLEAPFPEQPDPIFEFVHRTGSPIIGIVIKIVENPVLILHHDCFGDRSQIEIVINVNLSFVKYSKFFDVYKDIDSGIMVFNEIRDSG
ncbi:hypothetical protein WN48_01963 [Eufriesea mexicana]|uniref:Uncharacterized protein n=1 Tax=Eufriesea mexicana TaxID=516756 RepID=A0A310SQU5_9HYME|nr:hypothetical protein WN48_01963 [Eufriesea mexicana]